VHPVSQIIERNLQRRGTCDNGLWINPERDDCWQQASGICTSLNLFSQDHGAFRYLQASGAAIEFDAFPRIGKGPYDWIILNLPRQKALLGMLLDCVAALLASNGVLWLAGENRAGIKSAEKRLKSRFTKVRKLDNARHCTMFEAGTVIDHDRFDPAAYLETWPLELGTSTISVASYPGVFAHGRLDPGTALLLNVLREIPIEGEVLDFACGAGVIGATIARYNRHAKVTLLDNNALALRASGETMAGNKLDGTILASDGLTEIENSFDLVVTNPPVHTGVKTDTSLSMRLLDSIHEHISPGGRLIMVANIHLPYEKWLKQKFRRYKFLASNDHFKVVTAEK